MRKGILVSRLQIEQLFRKQLGCLKMLLKRYFRKEEERIIAVDQDQIKLQKAGL